MYFVSQSPLDIPEDIMGQLGTKIQHALRAFTPKDKKNVKLVADTFRENPGLNTRKVITELKTGEALVSVLDDNGAPTPVERILICPPSSRIGPLNSAERQEIINPSPMKGRYDDIIDRESAYEILKERAQNQMEEKIQEREVKTAKKSRTSNRQSYTESITKSVLRSVGSSLGRQIVRGIMKTLLGK